MEQEPIQNNKFEMNVWDFDQSLNGWREVHKQEGPEKAAELIVKYIELNRERISQPQLGERRVSLEFLNFHAGQLLAFAGKEGAVEYLNKSFQANSECWNAYVNATIGFLEKDQGKIGESISIIESSASEDKPAGNLAIVKNLLKALNQGITDYTTTYTMPRD